MEYIAQWVEVAGFFYPEFRCEPEEPVEKEDEFIPPFLNESEQMSKEF